MLDPRSLATRRDEIRISCARRGLKVDVDAIGATDDAVRELKGQLDEANRAQASFRPMSARLTPQKGGNSRR